MVAMLKMPNAFSTEPTGAETHLYGKIGGSPWCVTTRQRAALASGQRVSLRLPA